MSPEQYRHTSHSTPTASAGSSTLPPLNVLTPRTRCSCSSVEKCSANSGHSSCSSALQEAGSRRSHGTAGGRQQKGAGSRRSHASCSRSQPAAAVAPAAATPAPPQITWTGCFTRQPKDMAAGCSWNQASLLLNSPQVHLLRGVLRGPYLPMPMAGANLDMQTLPTHRRWVSKEARTAAHMRDSWATWSRSAGSARVAPAARTWSSTCAQHE